MSSQHGATYRPRTIAVCIAALVLASTAQAQTSFTYQGQLRSADEAVEGLVDFEFALWNDAVGGALVGSVLHANDVAVANGVFTVELDFGALAFNGAARWLEISVRSPAGVGVFETLSPRQLVTGAPYAAQAGGVRGLFVDGAENVGIGTASPDTRLHLVGADNNGTTAGLKITNTANADTMLLDGNEIDCVSGALYLNNNGDGDIIVAQGGGRVGIGVDQPNNRLSVAGGADFTENVGIGTTDPSARLHVLGPDNNGTSAGLKITNTTSADVMLMDGNEIDCTSGPLYLNHNSDNDVYLASGGGNVGIGTTNPESELHVVSAGGRAVTIETPGSLWAGVTSLNQYVDYFSGVYTDTWVLLDNLTGEFRLVVREDSILISAGRDAYVRFSDAGIELPRGSGVVFPDGSTMDRNPVIDSRTVTIDFGSIAAGGRASGGGLSPGALPGDVVVLTPTEDVPFPFMIFGAYCPTQNQHRFLLQNMGNAAVDPPPISVKVTIIRP